MKKILLVLLTFLTLTSCIETDTYSSDNFFIVVSKEMSYTSYKYLYRIKHYTASTTEDSFYLGYFNFVSNENYELGDTIKFIRYASNEI